MQNPLKLIYPDQCVLCGVLVEEAGGLCAACWAETPFLHGLTCDACAVPLLGEAEGTRPLCDTCLAQHPPWDRGRAVVAYEGAGRRLVLSLKHSDRLDLVDPAARWMAARGADLAVPGAVVVPVPLHWIRLVQRRYNQAALLARALAAQWGVDCLPDALVRTRRTKPQERMTRDQRIANQAGAIRTSPARAPMLAGRSVILVDDVMTSGATLRAATLAVREAGAAEVSVIVLARVVNGA